MSVDARTIDAIRTTILGSLVGQTLTGTGSPVMTVVLVAADDYWDPGVGPYSCTDGGVVVNYIVGTPSSTKHNFTTSSQGAIQRVWNHRYQIQVTADISACPSAALTVNLLSMLRQIVNLVEAAMEPLPSASVSYNMAWSPMRGPKRHPTNDGLCLFDLELTVTEGWAR